MPITVNRRQILAAGILSLAGVAGASLAKPTPPPLDVFARSKAIKSIALSPDAQKIAIITSDGDTNLLKTFARNSPENHTIGLGPAKVRNIFWADNDHVTLITSNAVALNITGGYRSELFQTRIFNPVTGAFHLLWDNSDGLTDAIVTGNVQRIRTAAGYAVTASTPAMALPDGALPDNSAYGICLDRFSPNVEKPQTSTGAAHRALTGELSCLPWATEDIVVAPDGRIVATSMVDRELQGVTKTWTANWNMSPSGKRPFMKEVYRTTYSTTPPKLLGLSGDGQSVVIEMYDSREGWQFFILFQDGTLSPPLDADAPGQHWPLFHPTTWRLAGFAHYDDKLTYVYFEPTMQQIAKALPLAMGDEDRLELIDFADDPRQVIVHVEGARDAGSYWFLDLISGVTTFLSDEYPLIDKAWLSEKKAIHYTAADGLEIPAYLTLPPYLSSDEARNLPLVVLPHGGPEARDTIDFDWQAQALASRGYAVLQPNFRGSSGYGAAFTRAGYGELGRKMQTDLSDGVRWLASQGIVDPKRVAICGASYGGYAALAGATLDSGVYCCAISIAGVSDLKLSMDRLKDRRGHYSDAEVYWTQYYGNMDKLKEISPIEHTEAVNIPILLIHGKDDTVVDYEQSVRMNAALKAHNKDVTLISYEGQDHWETIESARIDMITRVIDFLQKHNPA